MKKVLITGISGFVGTNLSAYLAQHNSFSLVGVSRSPDSFLKSDNKVKECYSYKDFFGSNKPDCFSYIHLAGKAHDLKNATDEDEYFKVNYELARQFFDHFLKNKYAKKFIFLSSVKAVADRTESTLTEDVVSKPLTAYGRSKLKAEEYIFQEAKKSDKKVYIFRPCMIHGTGNKGNLNLLYEIISKGWPWPLGLFDNKRSFLTVRNLCFVIDQFLSGSIESGIYNVADTETISTLRLVNLIAESNNMDINIWNIPKIVVQTVAKLGNVLPLPINEERLLKLTENYVVSNKKLLKVIKTELPFSAEEGLRNTFSSLNN